MEITKRSNKARASITMRKCNSVTLGKSESSKEDISKTLVLKCKKALDEQAVYCHVKASWRNGQSVNVILFNILLLLFSPSFTLRLCFISYVKRK